MTSTEFSGAVAQCNEQRRQAASSANLPLVDEASTGHDVRQLFARYRERFRRADLPGILLCFATNVSLLRGMLEIAAGLVFGESLLGRQHKEMIATFISRQNACSYCAGSHGAALAAHGGSADVICALMDGVLNPDLLTEAEIALLTFAAKVNRESSEITRADVEAAMREGWTEPQVAEAVHIAALFACFNRIANGFGLPSPYPDGLSLR